MKSGLFLGLYLLAVLAGGSGLFYYQYQIPDYDQMSQKLNERLLAIDGLDSKVNELLMRSRYNLDKNYDALVKYSSLLDRAVIEFENHYITNSEIENALMIKRFEEYINDLKIKRELVENFKSHNSVLRNSEKYAPIAGSQLAAIALQSKLGDTAKYYEEVVRELLTYSLHGSSIQVDRIDQLIPGLAQAEQKMPDYASTVTIEFNNHVNTVMREKVETDSYLDMALSSTADSRIENLSAAWSDWLAQGHIVKNRIRIYVGSYIIFLLLSVAIVAWKLRSLYVSLDQQVAIQTQEVKTAYKGLQQSEKHLMQSEKMASLGQLVAGVAHEINTPLGYISNNVDTIRLNLGEVDQIIDSLDKVSREASLQQPDKKKINSLIKGMIYSYRNMRKREILSEIQSLLKDSSYGLNEISELVSSLKDFSRVERTSSTATNIHDGLDATVKICGYVIGNRKLERKYTEDLAPVECMPAQLNQVFMNILTNAAQATDEASGRISISTQQKDQSVNIVFKDNGVGMNSEGVNQIFNPFYTTKDVGEGTGLGMSISYKIIKSHGGDIVLKSKLGVGTTITVILPLQQLKPELRVVG